MSAAATESWCLYIRELIPTYVVYGSAICILVWALEIGLWTACGMTIGDNVPGFCPMDFKEGKGVLFELSGLDGAKGATAGAAVLIVL